MDDELDEILKIVTEGCVVPTYIEKSRAKAKQSILALIGRQEEELRLEWLEEQTADIDEAIVLWRKNERKHHSWLLAWLEDNKRELAELQKTNKTND